MSNNLRITFDYNKPDEAALIVYQTFGGGYFMGSEPTINVVRTVVGKKAVALYSELSGKTIEQIEREANAGTDKYIASHFNKADKEEEK